jgi:hypothetical protein
MKSKTWYKATMTNPTPRAVYVQAVKEAKELYMIYVDGYCQFYKSVRIYATFSDIIYSCTKKTALRKFKFEEI